jgi:hypothetical protein
MRLWRLAMCVTCVGLCLSIPSLVRAQLRFSDQSDAAGIDAAYLAVGAGEYGGGGAVADFDRDGWSDVFLPSDNRRGGVLYINRTFDQISRRFENLAPEWHIDDVYLGLGVAVGDYDGDGWIDVFVAAAREHRLYHNEGGTRFSEVTDSSGVTRPLTTTPGESVGATFADYDLDGDLDLFVAGTFRSFVYRNNGKGGFVDYTGESGLALRLAQTLALSPRLIDMDGDRYPELLLVADHRTSGYFVNHGNGRFTDETPDSKTGLEENGMGQTVADFNGDGLLDWYVTSVFHPNSEWTGNKLYLNLGDHRFEEVASSAGVADGGFGWATLGVDFDHDGDVDLAETNGTMSLVTASFGTEQSYLWLNDGSASFSEVALDVGFEHFGVGHGMVNLDYDNDGDQDVMVFGLGPAKLLRNDLEGNDTHWLRVFLDTTRTPGLAPDGLGSRVHVTANGKTQVRVVDSGDSYVSVSEFSAHFGVGDAPAIDKLAVEWTDGQTTTLEDLAVDQTLTVSSPSPRFLRGDSDSDRALGLYDVVGPLMMLFLGGVTLNCRDAADIDDSGAINITDPVLTLQFLFRGNVIPAQPFPDCGEDPTDDELDCRVGRTDDC